MCRLLMAPVQLLNKLGDGAIISEWVLWRMGYPLIYNAFELRFFAPTVLREVPSEERLEILERLPSWTQRRFHRGRLRGAGDLW